MDASKETVKVTSMVFAVIGAIVFALVFNSYDGDQVVSDALWHYLVRNGHLLFYRCCLFLYWVSLLILLKFLYRCAYLGADCQNVRY